jgi:REP element-mobilizing transposase RayT
VVLVPRAPRLQAADVVYHVGSRGALKRPIFDAVPRDREEFLSLLGEVVGRFNWRCHAYCLMGNHFHLVVETPDSNLSAGMQYLKGEYASWFNAVHRDREGVLFERRFWSRIALQESHLYELARYLALNPVRARLTDRPEEWRWSSYAATVRLARAPAFLHVEGVLRMFGSPQRAALRFAQFVGEGMGDPDRAAVAIRAMEGSDPE